MKEIDGGGPQRLERRIALPTLADHMRRMRKRRELTQHGLAEVSGVSPSYIQKLETSNLDNPSREYTTMIADALQLSGSDRQTLFYLTGLDPVYPLPDVAQLRAQLTEQQHQELEARDTDLLAYFDPRWNLLACNTAYDYAFPGLAKAGNIMLWYFGAPESKQVLLDWPREAALNMAWFRGLVARFHPAPWLQEFIGQLEQHPEFVRMWGANQETVYGRDARDPLMYMLDPGSGEPYTLRVEQYTITNNGHKINRFVGIREAEFIPPLPPTIGRSSSRPYGSRPKPQRDNNTEAAEPAERADDGECA